MPLNLASPGIVVKEVDLTIGRARPSANITGAIVGPFAQGPVGEPTYIENENDLLQIFGQAYATDKQYETWLSASSYLAYGGDLRVVRADDNGLKNACVGIATTTTIKINSYEDYVRNGYDENTITNVHFAARNPGTWGNGIKVAMIDGKADQILTGIATTTITTTTTTVTTTFSGITTVSNGDIGITTTAITGITTTNVSVGYDVKIITGIIGAGTSVTGISTDNGGTVFLSSPTLNPVSLDNVELSFGTYTTTTNTTTTVSNIGLEVGYGVTQSLTGKTDTSGGKSLPLTNYYLKGIITEIGESSISVKILSRVSAAGTETIVDYQPNSTYSFTEGGSIGINTTGGLLDTKTYVNEFDWFDRQKITFSDDPKDLRTINWNNIAQRPGTSEYAEARGSRFDELHVVVIDDLGTVTGNAGTILEKHLSLSKGTDAQYSVGSPSYWRKYLAENSLYVFGGRQPVGIVTTGFDMDEFDLVSDIDWDDKTDGKIFGGAGSIVYTLTNGLDYGGYANINDTGALDSGLDGILEGYDLFESTENFQVDYLLMGSANYDEDSGRQLANKLISVAELRKDAVAFISPYRGAFLSDTGQEGTVTVNGAEEITQKVIGFFGGVASSSYAVFDSGYKYMYDRFANTFRYVPLNSDIAGLCARTDINTFPWFSPAGTSRGAILNAVKLPYNPTKSQRDRLYSNRINPVIFSPGAGIILFGDKTGYGKASAFDRINVRRLFLYLEDAISQAAKDQLFEFNDEITRTNFVNTIEPFLRDVQAKRGVYDYVVVCDETNNTAAVIDNNEFVADIYIKPARSINFIGLTFIATKTGVDFQEVIGNF